MKKLHYVALIVILALCLLASVALLNRGQDWGDDFALYIRQAASIAKGTEASFVAQNVFTNTNSSRVFGPSAGSWGFPLILSPFYGIFGLDLLALKVPSVIFFLLFLIVFFLLMQKRVHPMEGILIVGVLAFAPVLITFQNGIMSDIPFLAISTLSVWLILRFVCEGQEVLGSLVENLILGAVIFLAYLFRTNAVLLLFTLFVCQLVVIFQQRRKQADRKKMFLHLAIPYLVFGVLWAISLVIFPGHLETSSGTLSIMHQFTDPAIIKNNIYVYFHVIDEAFLGDISGAKIVYGALLAFFLIGVLARFKHDYTFLVYCGLTLGLLVYLPFLGGPRYLFPVIPFFVYFAFQGMKAGFSGLSKFPRLIGLSAAYLFWILLFIAFATVSTKIAVANLHADRQTDGPFDSTSTQMFDFIKMGTSPESVIVFAKPRAMLLMTDRNTIMINQCDQLARGDYIVLFRNGDWDQVSIDEIPACVPGSQQVFENQGFIVYKTNE